MPASSVGKSRVFRVMRRRSDGFGGRQNDGVWQLQLTLLSHEESALGHIRSNRKTAEGGEESPDAALVFN